MTGSHTSGTFTTSGVFTLIGSITVASITGSTALAVILIKKCNTLLNVVSVKVKSASPYQATYSVSRLRQVQVPSLI
ncbi:hypothetical protein [Candidatus Parabeggiatoa sp. HSG14]|uniref:hypothetical protein n=1 Tax=Candidatus Parabeggiatoa sp. HSG14 TaxID=3055593 RepID=UPI0032E3BFA5